PTGRARDRGPPRLEALDVDEPEGLGPHRRYSDHRRVGELLCQVSWSQPPCEGDPLPESVAARKPAHRLQLEAVAADDELSIHFTRRAQEHVHALGVDVPTCG